MSGKKFRFSLDSVLKLRSHESECARQDLADIRKNVHRQLEVVEAAESDLADAVSKRTTGSTGQRRLQRFDAYRREAHDKLEQERRKLLTLREREEENRLRLIECKSAEDAIRRLREQELERYRKAYEAAESQQLDEQAITSYQRQRRTANT